MKLLDWYRAHVKAQWAFVIVLLITAFCTYLTMEPGLDVTSYKVNAVVIGFLSSSAIVAAAVRAYPSMFLMVLCSLFMAVMLERFTHADIFKDAAFEGLMLLLVGNIGRLIAELFARFKSDDKE